MVPRLAEQQGTEPEPGELHDFPAIATYLVDW